MIIGRAITMVQIAVFTVGCGGPAPAEHAADFSSTPDLAVQGARPDSDTRRSSDAMPADRRPDAHESTRGGPRGTCQLDLRCGNKADCMAKGLADCVGGQCAMCQRDEECGEWMKGCDTSTGWCRICREDSDCVVNGTKVGTGKCDHATWNCLRCDDHADCGGVAGMSARCAEVPVLLGSTRLCVGCRSDADCAGAQQSGCDAAAGTCTRCRSDAECCPFGVGCGLTCDEITGQCACSDDAQCTAAFGGSAFFRCQR